MLTCARSITRRTKRRGRKISSLKSCATALKLFGGTCSMRILQLHSNFIIYKPVEKEIAQAEETDKKERRIDELMVLFTAVEEGDDLSVAQKTINELAALH